jgi:cytochrome c peroxidase
MKQRKGVPQLAQARLMIGLLAIGLISSVSAAEEPIDADYLAFLQAQGEAAWINANAEHPMANDAYRPIPSLAEFPTSTAKRDLGFALFHDTSLSRDGTVACNTCHMGMMGGTDGLRMARGIDGELGPRNTPTVFNAAFNFRQFWDGRAFDLDAQSVAPISNPVEMGHDLNAVVASLKADARYVAMFAEVYPDGVTAANIGNALAQHTKDMTRTDSPFNDYLTDANNALPPQAMRGKERFNALGCVACHNGINLGGNSYQPVASSFTTAMQYALDGEQGLAARSGREEDRLVFKVPQLHNVAMTAPYYHDGSVATLQDAIRRMGAQQIGRTINDQDVEDISAFLGSLSSAFFSGNRMHNMNDHQLQNAVREQMPDAMGQGHMMQGQDHTQHMQNMNQAAGHGMQHSPTTSATEEEADTAHQHGGH